MSFVDELKRRNVVRVAIAYLAVSWLLIQVVETVFPLYGLPDSAIRFVIAALAIGFLPALVIAWIFELTPEGVKRDAEVDRSAPGTIRAGKRFDRLIIAGLVLALGYFAFDKFVLPEPPDTHGEKSIAVLPLVNMSSDPEQENFADGIAEELLNLLARIDGLRVISRTSSFQFKDSGDSLSEIAEKLGVVFVLEGSVRKSGDAIRITLQLIDARADAHVWSETYTRTMDDIFAIQDEVAEQVVRALRITMDVAPLPVKRHDPEAYPLYLQARQILTNHSTGSLDQAEALLLQALKLDPAYADAKVELSWVHWFRGISADNSGDHALARQLGDRVKELLSEVAAVDSDNVELNVALGWNNMANLRIAAQSFERALSVNPHENRALNGAMVVMTRLRRDDEAARIGAYIVERDPLALAPQHNLARAYLNNGDYDLAKRTAQTMLALIPSAFSSRWTIGIVNLLQGNPEDALEQFQDIDDPMGTSLRLMGTAAALHDLGRKIESEAALSELVEADNDIADESLRFPIGAAMVYAWIGDRDAAFHYLEEARKYTPGDLRVWGRNPMYRKLENDPRWLPFLESAGLAPDQLADIKFNPILPNDLK